jgi:hypothetical protein
MEYHFETSLPITSGFSGVPLWNAKRSVLLCAKACG